MSKFKEGDLAIVRNTQGFQPRTIARFHGQRVRLLHSGGPHDAVRVELVDAETQSFSTLHILTHRLQKIESALADVNEYGYKLGDIVQVDTRKCSLQPELKDYLTSRCLRVTGVGVDYVLTVPHGKRALKWKSFMFDNEYLIPIKQQPKGQRLPVDKVTTTKAPEFGPVPMEEDFNSKPAGTLLPLEVAKLAYGSSANEYIMFNATGEGLWYYVTCAGWCFTNNESMVQCITAGNTYTTANEWPTLPNGVEEYRNRLIEGMK